MAPPKAWPFNSMASALRLTPIGHGASVISKLASAGSKEPSTKGVRYSNPSPYLRLTQSPVLPLKKLRPSIMTASGSLGSSPCAANYHPGRPPKDVSGSQVSLYSIGALVFAAGLSLLAVGSWIARKLPRWVPIFWVLSTIVGFIGYFVPGLSLLFVISGIIFGIGFAGAGIKVWSATSK
jgi:hypothetical protein